MRRRQFLFSAVSLLAASGLHAQTPRRLDALRGGMTMPGMVLPAATLC